MLFYFTIWSAVVGTVGLVMAFARTGPDEARSKLVEWAEFFRLNKLAIFLNKYALDGRVLRYGRWIMIALLFVGGMIFQGWLNSLPTSQVVRSAPKSDSATKPPEQVRSKQAINELLEESGSILNIIDKSGVPLVNEWRESITAQNPERICLDLDSSGLQDKVKALTAKLDDAQQKISTIFNQNRIDQAELNKAFASPIAGIGPEGFAAAAQSLRLYGTGIIPIGGHPTCEALVRAGNMSISFVNMIRNLDQFSFWVGHAQDNLSRYRDSLRNELRNAP
jgi:hypothetical protein